ncbi:MAG: RNA polymerase sigma factor [Saprospiraceae bacterium]
MQQLNEEEIIKWIFSPNQIKNDQAFTFIYQNYFGMIEKFTLSNNGKVDDAEDIFQDALIIFFNQVKNKNLKLTCSLPTYLYSICRNLWLKKLRKNKRTTELTDVIKQYVTIGENHFDILIKEEESSIVAQMLDQIGKDCKKVLLFFYFEKNRMSEIAEKMNLANEQVAKNKKLNCMKKLKTLVKGSDFFKNNFKGLSKK